MTEDTLELWYTIRVPDTCQTHIDIDDSSGELVIEVSGVGPAPEEASELINGKIVAGRVVYRADEGYCKLIDVKTEPIVA